MALLLLLLLAAQAACLPSLQQAPGLPNPDACCSHVSVKGGKFTHEGRYSLDTYNGEEVLKKDDFWGVMVIRYTGSQWSLCETSGRGSCYLSKPSNAQCVEESGVLFGRDLFTEREAMEVSCALAWPWYYILLVCLAVLVLLTVLFCCCCPSSPYRSCHQSHLTLPLPHTPAPYRVQHTTHPGPRTQDTPQAPCAPYQTSCVPYSTPSASDQTPSAPFASSGGSDFPDAPPPSYEECNF